MESFLKVLKGNLQFPNINIFNKNKTTNNIKFLCITNEGKLLILEDINTFNEIVKFYKDVEFHNSNLIFYNNLGQEIAAITLNNGVLDLLSNNVAKVNGTNIITDINGITANTNGSVTLDLNSAPRVVNSNTTAVNDETIIVINDSVISHPIDPVEGKGYIVIVVNGTANINGIDYEEGRIITIFFYSGSWRTKVYVDEEIIGSATKTALDLKENLLNKVTSITGATGTYPDTPTVKNYVDTFVVPLVSTGTSISFDRLREYNQVTPATGNLTNNLTGAQKGIIQKIYHNNAIAPTVPGGWVLIGGTYTTSQLNIIYAEWCGSSRVEYWITKG